MSTLDSFIHLCGSFHKYWAEVGEVVTFAVSDGQDGRAPRTLDQGFDDAGLKPVLQNFLRQ